MMMYTSREMFTFNSLIKCREEGVNRGFGVVEGGVWEVTILLWFIHMFQPGHDHQEIDETMLYVTLFVCGFDCMVGKRPQGS